jgi:hypothetical protein
MTDTTRDPRSLTTRLAVAAAGAGLAITAVGVAAPAYAERAKIKDPADASASLTDIRRVVVDHGPKALRVKVGFTDLRAKSDGGGSSLAIFLDTDDSKAGPEFKLGSGLQRGTDYQLLRVRKWKVAGAPLTCGHHVGLDFDADVLRFRAARPCLGDPSTVRVAVKMTDMYDASHPVTDWLKGPRKFTRWIASD